MKTTKIILGFEASLLITLIIISMTGLGGFSVALASLSIGNGTGNQSLTASDYGNSTLYLNYIRYMTFPVYDQISGNTIWMNGTVTEMQDATDADNFNAVQHEIFAVMANVTTNFYFGNVTLARADVIQRLQAMQTMARFNSSEETSQFLYYNDPGPGNVTDEYGYFTASGNLANTGNSSKHHKVVNVETFAPDWTNDFSGNTSANPFMFYEKNATDAYDAMAELAGSSGGHSYHTYGDCLSAIYTCYWYGTALAMGPTSFNGVYSSGLNMYNFNSGNLMLSANVSTINVDNLTGNVVPGDRVYFVNYDYNQIVNTDDFYTSDASGYSWLKPSPPASYLFSGENTIYMGIRDGWPLYSGLGMNNDVAIAIEANLAEAYNDDLYDVIYNINTYYDGSYDGILVGPSSQNGLIDTDAITLVVERLNYP